MKEFINQYPHFNLPDLACNGWGAWGRLFRVSHRDHLAFTDSLAEGFQRMTEEAHYRRQNFQPGTEIRLADGQVWTFPSAVGVSGGASDAAHREYLGLIRVHREAEDRAEQTLAELAIAIFLIGLNYQLDAPDLQRLFSFPAASPTLTESQEAFRALAYEHLRSFEEASPEFQADRSTKRPISGRLVRGTSWLRNFRSSRRWFLTTKSEAPF
jgi:hypothetical protein